MSRIIRLGHRDKPTVPAPEPAPAVGNPTTTTMPGRECPDCGAYMLNPARHETYHSRQDRWMKRADHWLNLFQQVAEARGWIVPQRRE